jgi:sulfur carrier protein
MITIYLNNQEVQVRSDSTLIDVIDTQRLKTDGFVFSVNNCVIAKSNWQVTKLNEGDQISLFQVIAGG